MKTGGCTARLFARAAFARAVAKVKGESRNPLLYLSEFLYPLVTVSAFIYIYKALKADEAYVVYVILGGVMIAFWQDVLWSVMSGFYWEKERGHMDLFIVSPVPPLALLVGISLGGLFITLVKAALLFVAASLLFGVDVRGVPWGMVLAVFSVTLLAVYGMGMMLSSLFLLYGRSVRRMTALLERPVDLLSGFFFPVKSLGSFGAAAACALPVTLGLDAVRQLMYPVPGLAFLDARVELALLAVQAALYLLLAAKAMAYMEWKAKKEGRLLTRWQ